MSLQAEVRRTGPDAYRDLSGRREREAMPPAGYIIAVSGVLAVVTFTLIYLTTLSFAIGF